MTLKVFIGWDSRETDAYNVCVKSLKEHSSQELDITPIVRETLIETGEYYRPQPEAGSVEFTYTRFLTPYLADYNGWALFIDCDFLPRNAVKMDGQKQVSYPRKNWSSCILWNCSHPSNKALTKDVASSESGAFLHRFQFLSDEEIGEIPLEWNWLEGEYDKPETPPAVIHFTNGGPWFDNWQDVDYAELWRSYL